LEFAMTATQSAVLQIILAVMIAILCAYSGGRVHQWYRQVQERDTAYREGYAQASRTLLPHFGRCAHGRAAHGDDPAADQRPAGPDGGDHEPDLSTRVIPLEQRRRFSY
jgi:hypothetical protein